MNTGKFEKPYKHKDEDGLVIDGKDYWNKKYGDADSGLKKNQTFRFAKAVSHHVDFSWARTLLDVGCGRGEAALVFKKRWPQLNITGIDQSAVGIDIANRLYGAWATFSVMDMNAIDDSFDVIYISNVVEHFVDYWQIARRLLDRCRWLCVMVPFDQRVKRFGPRITPSPDRDHQHSFLEDSFDFLLEEGLAVTIERRTFSVPGIHGWNTRQKLEYNGLNVFRKMFGMPLYTEDRQIVYLIEKAAAGETNGD